MDQSRSPATYTEDMVSSASSYSCFGPKNDFLAPEEGQDQGAFTSKDGNGKCSIRWKSGEKVDERLLTLLEIFFQEIYVKRREFFEKIFPDLHDQFTEVFKKIGAGLLKNKSQSCKYRTIKRSLSLGSPSERSQDQGLSELKFERFKKRTVAYHQGKRRIRRREVSDDEIVAYHQGPRTTAAGEPVAYLCPVSDDEIVAYRQGPRTTAGDEGRYEPKLPHIFLRFKSEIAGDLDEWISPPKRERFKVKKPRVIIAKPEGQGGQSGGGGTSSSTSTGINSN